MSAASTQELLGVVVRRWTDDRCYPRCAAILLPVKAGEAPREIVLSILPQPKLGARVKLTVEVER